MSWTSQGGVTLCCRLLVIVRSLRLVVLVFEECLELLWGGATLRCRLLVIVPLVRLVILVFEECLELLWGGATLHCRLLVIVRLVHLVVLVFAPPCLNCCYFFYLKLCLLFMRSVQLVVMVSLAVD